MLLDKLEVRPDGEFENFEESRLAGDDGPLRADLLVRVDGEGRIEDKFRLVFRGDDHLEAEFRASRILQHSSFRHFVFRYERMPAAIRLRPNSFTSRWEDLEALVAGGGLHVVDGEGKDAAVAFREAWEGTRATVCPAAAAVRWAAQASPAYGFRLTMQALPRTANALRKDSRLTSDTGKAVELASWTAPTTMAAGGEWKGPCPVLFSTDPQVTQRRIKENPSRLKTGESAPKTKPLKILIL